ncbi:MAG: phosphate butyryltransferase, partial [Clostridia bacterium]|nr:phosphate butyryltransferase [Clostridia bacterium]
MKGKIQTATLLKAVVDKSTGIRTDSTMSHVSILEVPTYHKLIAVTDAGMMIYPTLDQKKWIVQNAVNTFISLGYEKPKVAILAAVENVNEKMPETVDADNLKKMSQAGDLGNCIVDGPLSYDLAMSPESVKIKGFKSPVACDADILVAPNISAGNILCKSMIYTGGAKMAGCIAGAKVPIALTSRGATSEEKYLSLVLSSAAVK